MKLKEGIELVGTAVHLIKHKTLVLADLHIGYEEALNKEGILVPRFQLKDLFKHLTKIFKQTNPETIIVNGDLKHEFGKISEQEWRDTLKILDLMLQNSQKVVLVKGNHDTILGPIAKKRNVEVVDNLIIDDILITHGNKIPELDLNTINTIIIGHQHPAISIREGTRSELFKCFLVGKYKNKKLIVLPSTNFVSLGTDILQTKPITPFINSFDKFRVYVIGDKIYNFGRVSKLMQLQ